MIRACKVCEVGVKGHIVRQGKQRKAQYLQLPAQQLKDIKIGTR